MDQVALQLVLDANRADAQLRKTAALGERLFSNKGFKINVSTSGLPLGRITGDFDNFRKSLDAATARVTAFTATTGIIYGLADAFRRLFTESVKLEKQLASIQSILRVSGSELKNLSNDLLSVANATSTSFDVAVEAATEFSRQGLTLSKTIQATNAALALSRIAGIDAADAVSTLTATINTFNSEGLEYQDILDTIISLDNNFAASAAGIADGLKRIGSVASEAGIELKEIASLITVVQQVSARGETVISNGLKTILTRLNRSNVQDALNSIGVQTQTATGEFRSQIDVLTDLANKQDSLSDSQRAYINETVAGVFQINTLQATLKSLSGEYSLFDKALNIAGSSAGDTAARLRVLNDTASSSLQVLKNNLSRTFADLGSQTVLPILKDFTELSNGILKIFQSSNLEKAIDGVDTKGIGQKVGSGIIEGISSVLNSSGKAIFLAVLTRLFATVAKDIGKSILTLSDVNKGTFVNKELQDSVNKAIATGNQALVTRLATTDDIILKNQILNKLLQQQNQIGNLNLTDALVTKGLKKNKISTKAKGFIPALLKEKKDIKNGVGGASANAKPLIRELNLGKGREKVVVNSDELLVENYMNSGKDAIFNPKMVRDAGGLEALRKLGKVQNFAQGSDYKKLQELYLKEESLFGQSGATGSFATTPRGKEIRDVMARTLSGSPNIKKIESLISSSPTSSKRGLIEDLSNPSGKGVPRENRATAGAELNPNLNGGSSFESNPNLKASVQKKYSNFKLQERNSLLRRKEEAEILQLEKEERKLLEKQNLADKKSQKANKLAQVGLATSIGLPFATAGLVDAFGGDSKTGKRVQGGIEAASTGLAITSLIGFGPLGIAAGALVATFSLLKSESNANIKSFDQLKKNADKIIATNQGQINAVQGTIQAQNQLAELIKSNSSSQDRAKARENIISSSSQIDNEEIKKILLSGNNSKQSQSKLQDFQSELQKSSRIQEGLLVARKATEDAQKERVSLLSGGGLFEKQKKSFGADNFGAFVSPLIDAIDLTAISSGKGALALKRLASESINGAEFIKRLGEVSALTGEAANSASEEFQNIIDTFDPTSVRNIEKFIVAQLDYKKSIIDISKTLSEAENVTISFKKAFDISIKNLIKGFSFDKFTASTRAKTSLDINREVLSAQQANGEVTAIEAAKRSATLSRQESDVSFSEKSNALFLSTLNTIVTQVKGVVDPKKQGDIIKQVTSTLNGKSSLTELSDTLRKLVTGSEEADNVLTASLSALETLGQQAAELNFEQAESNRANLQKLDVLIKQLSQGPSISDILGGKTTSARKNLLKPEAVKSLDKEIEKLNKKIQVVGETSTQGQSLIQQRTSLKKQKQTLFEKDLEARKTLIPGSDPKLSDGALVSESEIKRFDFLASKAEIFKNQLEEIDLLSKKRTGSAKFGPDVIRKETAAVAATGDSGTRILEEALSKTFDKDIIKLFEEAFKTLDLTRGNTNLYADSVTIPKAANLATETGNFSASLGKTASSGIFSSQKLDQLVDIEKKLKTKADDVSLTSSRLKQIPLTGEKNLDILNKQPAIKDKFKQDEINKFISGNFTSSDFRGSSTEQKNIIRQAGLVVSPANESELKDILESQKKAFEDAKKERNSEEQRVKPELENLRKQIEILTGVMKSLGENTQGSTSKTEQDISLSVDVRGTVDAQLLADIQSSLTTTIDARIKEIVKDTFNIAAITKPTTAAA